MGSPAGFAAQLDLDELQNVVDNGSGARSVATRQANAQFNLGLTNSASAQTKGQPQVSSIVTVDASGLSVVMSGATQLGMVDIEQYIIQATEPAADSNAGLDSAAAAAVFTAGAGTITLAAGKTYMFEAVYNLVNTGTTSHTWAVAFGGTATFSLGTSYQAFGNSSGTANTTASGGLSGFFAGTTLSTAVVVTAASTSATEQVTVELMGVIVVNAGGTLIPQMKASARPGASGTPGVTHKAGSFFRIWQVPTLGAVGNWS